MKESNTMRIEHDSMGDVAVPADRYWGAQTQRSMEHFPIGVGKETMPLEIVHAFGLVKHAASWTTISRWSSGRQAPGRTAI